MLLLLIAVVSLNACAVNPVTGKKEMMLISESTEMAMGKKNYLPARQMQGGDYVADPAVTAYVRSVGQKLAAVSDRPLPYEFTVLNNSGINAWAMPGGKLAINRGLLMKMDSESELAAVLGHEIVHAAAKHSAKQMQSGMLLQAGVLAANIALQSSTDNPSIQNLGVLGSQMVAAMMSAKFSRGDELESDRYGMNYMSRAGYDPMGAVKMQEMLLQQKHGSNSLFDSLLASHPPSEERVAANRSYAAQLPTGRVGRNEYHQNLKSLFRTAPAYKAYDDGVKALQAKNYSQARTLADKAINIEPREAHFYLLRGSALEQSNSKQAALHAYQKAQSLNANYFESYLKLGLLYDAMGNRSQAKQALESSVKLLKTAPAMQKLGHYALQAGNPQLAKQYLSEAASSSTPAGQAAFADLVSFDLPANPQQYLKSRFGLNERGQLIIAIQNTTPYPVNSITVEVRSPAGAQRLNLRGTIAAKAQSTFNTGMVATAEQLNQIAVRIVHAKAVQ